jgi:hypothetical protein
MHCLVMSLVMFVLFKSFWVRGITSLKGKFTYRYFVFVIDVYVY